MTSLPRELHPLLDLLMTTHPAEAAAIRDGIERGWLVGDCRTCAHLGTPGRSGWVYCEMDDSPPSVTGPRMGPVAGYPFDSGVLGDQFREARPVCRLYERREAPDA